MTDAEGSIKRAMVLAAGFGTRLRPLTDHLPKPLIRLRGWPLLAGILARLQGVGVEHVVINAHHLPQALEDFVAAANADGAGITLLREESILGTGGGLTNARRHLKADTDFLLHNGDVLTDLDLRQLVREHRRGGALFTMALVDWPEANTVLLDVDGSVKAIGTRASDRSSAAGARRLTYTGVAVVAREFFDCLPASGFSSLIDGLYAAMRLRPDAVRGFAPPDLHWNDLGTLDRYRRAERDVYTDGGRRWPEFIWPVRPAAIRGQAADPHSLPLVSAAGFGPQAQVIELAQQGSGRLFRRLREDDRTAVLMQTGVDDPDFDAFVDIGRFLHGEQLGAPEILAVDADARAVLLEDLGDETLQRAAGRAGCDHAALYRRVIDLLVDLQVRGTASSARCPAATLRLFDHDVLRWETEYFREHFLRHWCGLPSEALVGLDEEFERLAAAVLTQPRVLLHRDFQSQNILLLGGRVRLVDFQGLRPGPPAYDLMSLLRDSYVDLSDETREQLREYYRRRLAAAGGDDMSAGELAGYCVTAGLQRNMQALGAFARLTRSVGRGGFDGFIPAGLRNLRHGLREARSGSLMLSHLEEIVSMLP